MGLFDADMYFMRIVLDPFDGSHCSNQRFIVAGGHQGGFTYN